MSRESEISKIVTAASKEFADQGLLIEAGWVGFKLAVLPPNAPQEQVDDMRASFFAGAQHLFTSIMVTMDEDQEPTEQDMRKFELIDEELQQFLVEFKRKHKLG